jgi:hypothetical protein
LLSSQKFQPQNGSICQLMSPITQLPYSSNDSEYFPRDPAGSQSVRFPHNGLGIEQHLSDLRRTLTAS